MLRQLQRFYKTAALPIGLGKLSLRSTVYQAWRAYDRLHCDRIQPRLSLYGPLI